MSRRFNADTKTAQLEKKKNKLNRTKTLARRHTLRSGNIIEEEENGSSETSSLQSEKSLDKSTPVKASN